jgi:Family of unknown function (DUF5343)
VETEQVQSAAYLPFATFLTGLDHLAAIGLTNKIEPSTFVNMNPTNKTQMVSALKFFGLINKESVPQPLLSDLVHKQDQRKEIMRGLIEKYYPDIVALDFAKMTPSQLDAALAGKQYNITGGTRKKAKAFLLKAAQFAGFIPHPLLTKITRTRRKGIGRQAAGGNRAGQADTNGNTDTDAPPVIQGQDEQQGTKKTIQLRRGGSLTLSLAVNILELKGDDRAFVFELIDKLEEYEQRTVEPSNKEEGVIRVRLGSTEANQ